MTSRWAALWTLCAVLTTLSSETSCNFTQCDCGWFMTYTVQRAPFSRRIIGGVDAKLHEFPMMAALLDLHYDQLYCGATIIAKRYAVTAAHCAIYKNVENIGLLVGDHISSSLDTKNALLHLLLRFVVHPEYDTKTHLNDIALVHVGADILFNGIVGPACLPFRFTRETFVGRTVVALGWGVTKFEGVNSNVLQKVGLTVVNDRDCFRMYQGMTSSDQICTYAQGKDACQNDSGGPILLIDNNRVYLVGVISYGVACGTIMPGVNTRVTSYLDWVRNSTPEVNYCVY
ncbi:venom serine protease 34-like [Periplaneta americana]|uniref:venom serine protease 34-like n=1 Tax=Periplaneta americana TaxID=6978 RepID=UPI0037E6FE3E